MVTLLPTLCSLLYLSTATLDVKWSTLKAPDATIFLSSHPEEVNEIAALGGSSHTSRLLRLFMDIIGSDFYTRRGHG